ncbi:hypothetical protein [Psychroserpens mesophilus]|uniref:hypothetical protein n=1 Tax=Psychroserpens mesophilus TaxID=325473 RepID=UPI00058BF71F|nr:hypothetical protein [Psychroserpens mesophilus]
MTKKEIIDKILESDIFKKWHFFKYHFDLYNKGSEHLLAKSIVDAILEIENQITNAGLDYINKIASINNKENETKHYDQLLQVLAELLIVHHAISFDWPELVEYIYEPTSTKSNKNPELLIKYKQFEVGIEVKAPELVKKQNERGTKPQQLPSRSGIIKSVDIEKTMLPRDNPVKDFLISTDKKFAGFKADNPEFYGVLVIVWDDFIYEPISSLTSPQSGLFTENSFAINEKDEVLKFPNVDCVIITRHLRPIKRGTRDEPLPDMCLHPLDYGRSGEFPFKVYIKNPNSNLSIPSEVLDCFQALKPGPELGAEYLPSDFITWFGK